EPCGLPCEVVQQLTDVTDDGVTHRTVALIVRYVRPVGGLPGLLRLRGQRTTDREDVRGGGDVTIADGRRLAVRNRDSVGLQAGDGTDGQVVLRRRPSEDRAIR